MQQQIEKSIQIEAPVSRVWNALTDYQQFGEWFGVRLDQPFVAGQPSTGMMGDSCGGKGAIPWNATIVAVEPETYFAYSWKAYAVDPKIDYSKEQPTLVEFRLAASDKGTLLTVKESGFENVPEYRRDEAYRMHEFGWTKQLENVQQYATAAVPA
jgi:uncharacterized protein YndB with AHSA1/START domain